MNPEAITDQVKIEFRNRYIGTIGSAARRSMSTKATSTTVPTARRTRTSGSVQPCVPPRLMPSRAAVTPIVIVEMPAWSTVRGMFSSGTFRKRTIIARAASPTGRLMKKSHRQEEASVIAPPISGPATWEAPMIAPMYPRYLPRCRGGMTSPRMVWESGMRIPMPIPWTAREATSQGKFIASPDRTEPTMNTTRPRM